MAQRLLDLADRHSDPVLRAQAHDVLSIACLVSRDFRQALVHAQNALDLYKADDVRDPLAYVLNVQGMAYFGQGRLRQAIDSFEEARSRGREADSPRVESFSLFYLSRALRANGELGRALEMAELAATALTRIGAPEAAAASAFRDALTAGAAGDGQAMARALLLRLLLRSHSDLLAHARSVRGGGRDRSG